MRIYEDWALQVNVSKEYRDFKFSSNRFAILLHFSFSGEIREIVIALYIYVLAFSA